jgi:uncharacterized protein
MTNAWEERKKALENEYIHRHEREVREKIKAESLDKVIREQCKNRCPKCGDPIVPTVFRSVPLDRCPSCGGVWLGPNDLRILASKDHRTWFEQWFGDKNK